MADDHDEDRPAYDPAEPAPPEEAPPLRSTAPQSDFSAGQVAVGFVVLLIGIALTFGVAVALV